MRAPLLLLLVALAAGVGRGAASAQAATVSGFTVVHGKVFAGQLRAVSARTPTDVWAVGMGGSPTSVPYNLHPYAEHWNGHTWTSYPAPMPPGISATSAFFLSVSAVSQTNVWAAGVAFVPSGQAGFVEHWNGTKWSVISAAHGDQVLALSATSVWVVDSTAATVTAQPQHYNGHAWQTVTPPVVNGNPLNFTSLAGQPGNVWFGSNIYLDGNNTPVMAHWDGKTWTTAIQSVSGSDNASVIAALSMSTTGSVFGAGYSDFADSDDFSLYGLIFNAGVWSSTPFTQYPDDHQLRGVAATGDGQAWAVGDRDLLAHTLIEHWDSASGRWVDLGGPNPCTSANILSGVAGAGGTQTGAYAVGWCGDASGDHPVILHHA